MAKLAELGLKNEKVGGEVGFADLPKQGGFMPLLQPGRYRFQLPANLGDVFDKVDTQKGERLNAVFDQNAPLVIVQAPAQYEDRVGEPFQVRLSNAERPRGKDKIEVSDMDYLLRALGESKPAGVKWTNLQYGQALAKHGGKQFDATVSLSWYCNPKRDIYVDDGQGGYTEVAGTKGCDTRYYQKDVDKQEDGQYAERITCGGKDGQCGASIRAFAGFDAIG